MEWYYWLIIGYAVWVFITAFIKLLTTRNYGFFVSLGTLILAFFVGLVISPFLWLISLYYYFSYKTPSYKSFTIHKLSEDNKTTLRNLGFQEGEFVSNNNIDYKGFRYNRGEVAVQYNGRVFAKYLFLLSKEQKHLIAQIKALPKPINYNEKIEELQKQIKDKKDSQANWKKWYQDDIEKMNKQIEELKLKKQEENK
jgi:hypothetical protein